MRAAISLRLRRRKGKQRFECSRIPRVFASVPGSPFAFYWVSGDRLRSRLRHLPIESPAALSTSMGTVARDWGADQRRRSRWCGPTGKLIQVGADERANARWHCYAKGGKATKFYFIQVHLRFMGWDRPRKSTCPGVLGRPSADASEKPSNYELYFQPGLTWPLRASAFSPQVMPAGCIFGHKGPAILVQDIDDEENLLALTRRNKLEYRFDYIR